MAEAAWTVVVRDLEALASAPDAAGRRLSRWLARGRSLSAPRAGWHAAVAWALTGDPEGECHWPPAPLTWREDFETPPPPGILRLDPVHLDASGARIGVITGDDLAVAPQDSAALATAVAEALGPDRAPRLGAPTRWYVTLEDLPECGWTAPDGLAAGDAVTALPRGGAARLGRLMATVEMCLHDHPVNRARRERGLPEINAAWPWGWGPVAPPPEPVARVLGDDPYGNALARLAGTPRGRDTALSAPPPAGGGAALWPRADARALVEDWLRPLVGTLLRGRVRRLRLVDAIGRAVELDRLAPLRLWRGEARW